MPLTQLQVEAFKSLCLTLLELVPPGEFPMGGIPNGHLYAMVMSRIDIDLYTLAIDTLQRSKLIKLSHHYITRLPTPTSIIPPPFPEAEQPGDILTATLNRTRSSSIS